MGKGTGVVALVIVLVIIGAVLYFYPVQNTSAEVSSLELPAGERITIKVHAFHLGGTKNIPLVHISIAKRDNFSYIIYDELSEGATGWYLNKDYEWILRAIENKVETWRENVWETFYGNPAIPDNYTISILVLDGEYSFSLELVG